MKSEDIFAIGLGLMPPWRVTLAKQRARGFADIHDFIDMAYFVCGKLKFDYPYNSL